MRILLIAFILLHGAAPVARAVEAAALERGTAITDPATLRELDGGRFRLDRMLQSERSADAPLSNDELFRLPSMMPVRQAIDGEFDRYVVRHRASLPKETIGVGENFDFQLFDRALLYSTQTRFVLAGIVNRMDRAYVSPADCGEVRLIYRLTRLNAPDPGDNAASQRLPMTLNLVLKAKADKRPIAAARRSHAPGSQIAGSRPVRSPPRNCRQRIVRSICSDLRTSTASRPTCRSPMRRNPPFAISAPTISSRCFATTGRPACSRKRRWKTRSTARASWPTTA